MSSTIHRPSTQPGDNRPTRQSTGSAPTNKGDLNRDRSVTAANDIHALQDRSNSRARTSNRPRWRQRLIDAERGMSHSLKRESTLYVYLFGLSVVFAAAFVLGLSLIQWSILIVCATIVLTAELFNMALRALDQSLPKPANQSSTTPSEATRIASAAGLCTVIGSLTTIALIFAQQLKVMWTG